LGDWQEKKGLIPHKTWRSFLGSVQAQSAKSVAQKKKCTEKKASKGQWTKLEWRRKASKKMLWAYQKLLKLGLSMRIFCHFNRILEPTMPIDHFYCLSSVLLFRLQEKAFVHQTNGFVHKDRW